MDISDDFGRSIGEWFSAKSAGSDGVRIGGKFATIQRRIGGDDAMDARSLDDVDDVIQLWCSQIWRDFK